MEKCLVTKLSSYVDNPSILKIGEIRLNFKQNSSSNNKCYALLKFTKDTTISIDGAVFMDDTYTTELGNSLFFSKNIEKKIYFICKENVEVSISIPDKYALSTFLPSNFFTETSYDVENFKYCTSLESFYATKCKMTGDVKSFENCVNLKVLSCSNSQVYGDVGVFKNLHLINTIEYDNANGNINELNSLDNLIYLFLRRSNDVRGDIATLPSTLNFLSLNGSNSNVTWSSRNSPSTIIGLEGMYLDNVDKMLQDQANCTVPSTIKSYLKKIIIDGTRTSESDEAVATLQSKGYTVSITPV